MNTQEDFRSLMTDFCKEAGLPPDETIDSGNFKLGDFQVSMFFNEVVADVIFIYFDLGDIEPGCEMRAYQTMLMGNIVTGSQDGGVLGLHPITGRAIHASRVYFGPETKGRDLLVLINRIYRNADELYATAFVPQPGDKISSSSPRHGTAVRT